MKVVPQGEFDYYADVHGTGVKIEGAIHGIDAAGAEVRGQLEAERKRRDELKAAVEKAAGEKALAEREEWIRQHGSPRLKKAVASGVKHDGIYNTERLAHDLPGWEYWETGVQPETDHNEVINAEEHELDALLAAREQYPAGAAELWSIYDRNDEDRAFATVLAMKCPWEPETSIIKRLPAAD